MVRVLIAPPISRRTAEISWGGAACVNKVMSELPAVVTGHSMVSWSKEALEVFKRRSNRCRNAMLR